jgi:lipopolysaccharide transport system ATP-binding protein
MTRPAIEVHNLGKRYRIGRLQERPDSLREMISQATLSPFRRIASLVGSGASRRVPEDEIIWALKDISFSVEQGEVVGFIGRNGAGKSTLLKVLSRITQPTEGRARIRGRVGSLLEVGTGFHQELTGRENIYLNGAILGMRRTEIERKFDEIVAFSGVERFIDTPVKRYSSGMYLRLAFAVAAHLEPEILLVDEVLAVGDAEFQKKCLGKMGAIAGQGRTVLFVSHNMAAVQSLCSRAIMLSDGRVVADGPVVETVNTYIASVQDVIQNQPLATRTDRQGGDQFRFLNVEFLDAASGATVGTLMAGQDVVIKVDYDCRSEVPLQDVTVSIGIRTLQEKFLFSCQSNAVARQFDLAPGQGSLYCRVPRWPLGPGRYLYSAWAAAIANVELDFIKEAGYLDVEPGDYYGTGILPGANLQGVFVDYDWTAESPLPAVEVQADASR